MYALLGVLLVSRYLAWAWTGHLSASRSCERDAVQIGESVTVNVTVFNLGKLPVPWLLIEDSLPLEALRQHPPRLQVKDQTLMLAQMKAGSQETLELRGDIPDARLLSVRPVAAGKRRSVRLAPPLSRNRPHRIACWFIPKWFRSRDTTLPPGGRSGRCAFPIGCLRIRRALRACVPMNGVIR